MQVDVVYTGPSLKEEVIGRATVLLRSNIREIVREQAEKKFKDKPFTVRKDQGTMLFPWVAVDADGNTIHLQ
jgi:hypothetical protein